MILPVANFDGRLTFLGPTMHHAALRLSWFLILLLSVFTADATSQDAGRTQVRLLYSFEQPGEVAQLAKLAENAHLITVQDNGVTDGKNCARLTIPKGADYGLFHFGPDAIKAWGDFDYFAMDVYTDDDHPYSINFELFDGLSKNYATRCTMDQVTHPGRQTLLFRINRAKRNGKEGREWDELEPQDKIQRNALTRVKIFTTPRKDRDAVLWIDNLRLMQEDAAKPKLRVRLPDSALAFNFGSPGTSAPGFRSVSPQTVLARGDCGFVDSAGLVHGGEGWPDLLAGTFVTADAGQPFEFRARVPNGEYRVWLCAGPILRPFLNQRKFLLAINGQTLVDEEPSMEDLHSEKFLFRFLNTQYSEKPHALWTNYLNRMYPVHTPRISVTDGFVSVRAAGHFLSALVLVPAASDAAFSALASELRTKRIEAFEQTLFVKPQQKPAREPADGPYVIFVPDDAREIRPWTGPTAPERARRKLRGAAAPGQRIVFRVAVTPFADLGRCELKLSDLTHESVAVRAADQRPIADRSTTIRASQIRGHFQNYRWDGGDVGEMALLPSLSLEVEAGVTQCFWLWLATPTDVKPGTYRGRFTFQPPSGAPTTLPVELEVYPFRLADLLPASFGMYYNGLGQFQLAAGQTRRLVKEQLQFMRQVGFTAVPVGGPTVTGLGRNHTVNLKFDPTMFELARETGFARRPEQLLMGNALGMGRAIGRRLPGSQGARVDQSPGIELKQPGFREYFVNAAVQYRDFLKTMDLPTALEVVDEPREVPNPWNRNLADTIAYADMLHEAPGLRTFVTPMADSNSGKDYTVLIDHVDIVSIHAWQASAGFLRKTRPAGKTLWLYNTGMDRYSWGFYNWRVDSAGRWEWHFCFPEDNARGGYPGREWHNPFTSLHGHAPHAPLTYPGGMVYSSAFLNVCEGINDYAYLHMLEQALAKAPAASSATAREATAFLAALKKSIPELPNVKGLASEADGALVGLGLNDEARLHAAQWRESIAEYLKKLAPPAP